MDTVSACHGSDKRTRCPFDGSEVVAAHRPDGESGPDLTRAAKRGRESRPSGKAHRGPRRREGPGGQSGRATPQGAEWTAEVDRLRTLREQNRLTGIARVPRPVALAAR